MKFKEKIKLCQTIPSNPILSHFILAVYVISGKILACGEAKAFPF